MTDPRVTGLRSAVFRVPDLKAATRFYEENWGLEVAAADGDTVYLRGTGKEHHALALPSPTNWTQGKMRPLGATEICRAPSSQRSA